jgi:ferritin-like metal-binding protein YciE
MAARNKALQDFMIEEMRDIYHAEKQITKALPKMERAATNEKLKEGFRMHLEQTRGQIERLEQAFEELDLNTRGKPCEAMQGLLAEARELMEEENLMPEVLDAALVVSAQKVEHYEIAAYGALRSYAEALGHKRVAQLMNETLEEEKETDQKLNQLAMSEINPRALETSQQDTRKSGKGESARSESARSEGGRSEGGKTETVDRAAAGDKPSSKTRE